MSNIIKLKRGSLTNLQTTTLQQGEPAITTDSNEFFIGTSDGAKNVFFPITTNEVLDDSTATITLSNNKDIRIPTTPNNNGLTSLTLSFSEDTFSSSSRFNCKVSFKTSSTGCGFTITPPTDVIIKYSGDSVTDNVFTPVAGYGYDLTFYWNGLYMTCLVSGTSLSSYTLTVTSSGVQDLYIFSSEDETTPLSIIDSGESKTFALATNYLYAAFPKSMGTSIMVRSSENCTTERVTSTYYNKMKITLTDTSATINLQDERHSL